MIPPSRQALELPVHYFSKWFYHLRSHVHASTALLMLVIPETSLTSFSNRTNGFESNQTWQDKIREKKKGGVWITPSLIRRSSYAYPLNSLCLFQYPNLFFFWSLTLCIKKQLDHKVKLLQLKYYFPNAVSNRDEIGKNFYDDNKTLCVEVNG